MTLKTSLLTSFTFLFGNIFENKQQGTIANGFLFFIDKLRRRSMLVRDDKFKKNLITLQLYLWLRLDAFLYNYFNLNEQYENICSITNYYRTIIKQFFIASIAE